MCTRSAAPVVLLWIGDLPHFHTVRHRGTGLCYKFLGPPEACIPIEYASKVVLKLSLVSGTVKSFVNTTSCRHKDTMSHGIGILQTLVPAHAK